MNHRLFSAITCVLAGVALSGCRTLAPQEAEGSLGRRFTATIPGTWNQSIQIRKVRCEMTKTYFSDGSAKGVLRLSAASGNTSIVIPTFSFKSRWRVTGDIVETYAMKCSYPGMLNTKEVIQDRLVSVELDRVSARALKGGQLEVFTRTH
jgi:hypothetical protein